MKLRNKKTGEIIDLYEGLIRYDGEHITINSVAVLAKCYIYNSLAELNKEWEDYEEPKEYWYIEADGTVNSYESHLFPCKEWHKQIGNYFETKEEAEKAVERLHAWKRLKDKGFRFEGFTHKDRGRLDELEIYCQLGERPEGIEDMEDVHLLFGGEE